MRITICFESETVPDYVRGETESQNQSLDLFFDGKNIEVYSEFMDRIDKKVAVGCIRSVLDLYEKKEEKMTND